MPRICRRLGENMDSKDFLGQIFQINKRIALIETELEVIEKIRKKYPNQNINNTLKSDLENILKLSLDDLINYKTKMFILIKSIPDMTVRCVMEYRYITGLKFDDIAERLFYSKRQVLRYYSQGHEYITKLLEKTEITI